MPVPDDDDDDDDDYYYYYYYYWARGSLAVILNKVVNYY
jgi:hypothetical protein